MGVWGLVGLVRRWDKMGGKDDVGKGRTVGVG